MATMSSASKLDGPGLAPADDVAARQHRDRLDHPPVAKEESSLVGAPGVLRPGGDLGREPVGQAGGLHTGGS